MGGGGNLQCRDTGMCHYFGYFLGVLPNFGVLFGLFPDFWVPFILVKFNFFQNNTDFWVLILIFY